MNGYISAASPRHSRIDLWLGISFAALFLVLILASGGLVWAFATQAGGHSTEVTSSGQVQNDTTASEELDAPATPIGGTVHPQAESQAGEPVAVWTTTLVDSVPPGQSANGFDIDATYEHPNGSVYIVGVKTEDGGSGQTLLDSLGGQQEIGKFTCEPFKNGDGTGCVGTVEGIGLIAVRSTDRRNRLIIAQWGEAFVDEMHKAKKQDG